MTMTKNKVPVFGVIVSGVDRDDATTRYLDAINGNSVSLYTSKSSNLSILSESGTHLYNPITSVADLEESDTPSDSMLSSYSSSDDSVTAHYTLCSDGCGAHVISSDANIAHYCPVCASELSEPDEDDGIEEFDDEVLEDDYDSEASDDEELSDAEIDAYSVTAGISLYSDDDDEDDEEDDEEISDEDLESFSNVMSMIAGEDCDPEVEDCDDEDDDEEISDEDLESFSNVMSMIAGEDCDPEVEDCDDEDDEWDTNEENVEHENVEASNVDIVSVSDNKEDAIANYAECCISGAASKYVSSLTGHTFYSASSDSAEINFDPLLGDPNLEVKSVMISTSSMSESEVVDAHYMVCASEDCGAHIVTSNESMSFCPVCSSNVEEPVENENDEDDAIDNDDEDDSEFSLNILDDLDDEDGDSEEEVENKKAINNEKALSRVLSFVAGGDKVLPSKLNVSYCGNIAGENSWIAFYNGQPIAKSTSSSAVRHTAIFDEPAYANAVIAGAEHLGISKILDEMGFKASMSSVAIAEQLERNLNKHYKEKLQAMSEQLEQEVQTKSNDYVERFVAALSTAAVGINRGFFKGYVNPVKQTLLNSLSAAGVRQPEIMLDNVYRSHSDDYHKLLIEKTLEIVEKPSEVQNEIAIAVSESNYMSNSSSTYNSNVNVEDRLTTMGKEVETSQSATQVAIAQNVTSFDANRLKSVVQSLGKRF